MTGARGPESAGPVPPRHQCSLAGGARHRDSHRVGEQGGLHAACCRRRHCFSKGWGGDALLAGNTHPCATPCTRRGRSTDSAQPPLPNTYASNAAVASSRRRRAVRGQPGRKRSRGVGCHPVGQDTLGLGETRPGPGRRVSGCALFMGTWSVGRGGGVSLPPPERCLFCTCSARHSRSDPWPACEGGACRHASRRHQSPPKASPPPNPQMRGRAWRS